MLPAFEMIFSLSFHLILVVLTQILVCMYEYLSSLTFRKCKLDVTNKWNTVRIQLCISLKTIVDFRLV